MAEDPWLTPEQREMAALRARMAELEAQFDALVTVVAEVLAER